MYRPAPHFVGAKPSRNFFGRAVGERECADALRIETGVAETLNAGGEAERLSRARTCHHEHRPERGFDRATLLLMWDKSHFVIWFANPGEPTPGVLALERQ